MAYASPRAARHAFVVAFGVLSVCAGCQGGGGSGSTDAGTGSGATTLHHEFPAFDVASGQEIYWQCQSWTLNNDQPIYVSAVHENNDGVFHHSNWFFVRDNQFRGPDGTWGCDDRGFDEVAAGLNGGVLFAQSTQSMVDDQVFPAGAAMRIPAHARIVGDVHLLNVTPDDKHTAIRFTIDTIPESDVMVKLQPMSFTNLALDIKPRGVSQFVMDCDLQGALGGTLPDFSFYYVLPHYHELGNLMRIELIGGANDGEVVLESSGALGDPWGKALDPPIAMNGATGIRITCGYDNPRDVSVGYGIGDQEMCVFLAYTDSNHRFVGDAMTNHYDGLVDGIYMNHSDCQAYAVPAL